MFYFHILDAFQKLLCKMSSIHSVLVDVVLLYLKYENVPLSEWPRMLSSRVNFTINRPDSRWKELREEVLSKGSKKVGRDQFIAFFRKQKLEQHWIDQIRLYISVEEEEVIRRVSALPHSYASLLTALQIQPNWTRQPGLVLNTEDDTIEGVAEDNTGDGEKVDSALEYAGDGEEVGPMFGRAADGEEVSPVFKYAGNVEEVGPMFGRAGDGEEVNPEFGYTGNVEEVNRVFGRARDGEEINPEFGYTGNVEEVNRVFGRTGDGEEVNPEFGYAGNVEDVNRVFGRAGGDEYSHCGFDLGDAGDDKGIYDLNQGDGRDDGLFFQSLSFDEDGYPS